MARLTLIIGLVVGLHGFVGAQAQNPDLILTAGDGSGPVGGEATITVTLDNLDSDLHVRAWAYGVSHDSVGLDVTSVVLSSFVETINGGNPPAHYWIEIFPGEGWDQGVVIDFSGQNCLPAGAGYPLAEATYALDEAGAYDLCLGHLLGGNPVQVDTCIGESYVPVLVCGEVVAGPSTPEFIRGDCNADGLFNVGDPIFTVNFLFSGGDVPVCGDACDTNDDGAVDVGDPVYTLNHLFVGGPAPLAPFPGCGDDPTGDDLSCAEFVSCP